MPGRPVGVVSPKRLGNPPVGGPENDAAGYAGETPMGTWRSTTTAYGGEEAGRHLGYRKPAINVAAWLPAHVL